MKGFKRFYSKYANLEELPEDTVHPLHLNGVSVVPASLSLSLPPSIPPPRKTDTTEELSQSEREAVEAKLRDMHRKHRPRSRYIPVSAENGVRYYGVRGCPRDPL